MSSPSSVARALLRDRRQLGARLVIRSVRADLEPVGIDARGGQLRPRAGDEIARQQSERSTSSRCVERVEQLVDARHHANVVGAGAQLLVQIVDVSLEQRAACRSSMCSSAWPSMRISSRTICGSVLPSKR